MCRWSKLKKHLSLQALIPLSLAVVLAPQLVCAQTNYSRAKIDSRMKAVETKVLSTAPLAEKLQLIRAVDLEINLMISNTLEQAKKDKTVLEDPVYLYTWDLYDDLIPLLNLKLNTNKTAMTEKSCIEVTNSVLTREQELLQDEALASPSSRAQKVIEMIRALCATKGKS